MDERNLLNAKLRPSQELQDNGSINTQGVIDNGCKAVDIEDSRAMNYRDEKVINKIPKLEQLQRHEITIIFLDRGCIVKVGCKKLAFETNQLALAAIRDYIADPVKEAELWQRDFNKVNEQ